MIKSGLKILAVMLLALGLHKTAFADEVALPTDELAKESVLPIFDKTISVKNRRVVTDGRVEVVGYYSYAMTEAIMNVSRVGASVYYNTSETHVFGLSFAKNFSGISNYSKQMANGVGSGTGGTGPIKLDFTRAPFPEMSAMFDYNAKLFYGKLSLAKNIVFNTILYASAAVEMTKYVNKTYPGIAFGIGQKFYITDQLAFRFDMRFHANQGPNPVISDVRVYQPGTNPNPSDPNQNPNYKPSYDRFPDHTSFSTTMDAGLSFLF